jgi:voltage-gated potassium channel
VAFIREEAARIWGWEERHRRLVARLSVVLVASLVVDALGTVAIYYAEHHAKGTEITTLGDALFFATVQLLTVSSQIQNPFTTWGRVVDVVLQLWAVVVVAGSAGAIAAFFQRAD